MERNRGTTIAIVASLVIAVVSLGVAFAAFSTQLNINGTATVESSSWDVHYSTSSGGTAPSSSGTSVSPTTSNTQSGITSTASGTGTLKPSTFTWSGSFQTPGDRLTYTFYICNKGSYNAKLTSMTTPAISSCTKGGSAETTVCQKISYGVYTNSGLTTALEQNATIAKNTCTQIWVAATLSDTLTAAQLPNAQVTVNPVTIDMTWSQY